VGGRPSYAYLHHISIKTDAGLNLIWNPWDGGRGSVRRTGLSAAERSLACELVASRLLDVNDSGGLRANRRPVAFR
jgi:hypothetical protein